MSPRTTTLRRSVTTSTTQPVRLLVFGLLLVLCLAPLSGAGDPDDDWGLPAMPANDSSGVADGGSEGGSAHALSAEGGSALSAPVATHLESALSLELGHLVISAPQSVAQGPAASVQAIANEAAITTPTLVGSSAAVAVQGAAFVEFGPSFGLQLHTPAFASLHVGFLLIDDGEVDNLSTLLHTVGGRARVSSVQPLGAGLSSLDVARMQKLVTANAESLQDQRVSLVILSLGSQGAVQLSAVRMVAEGAQIELLTD